MGKLDTAAVGATKELWVPITWATAGVALYEQANAKAVGGVIAATGDEAGLEFYIPNDYSSITSAVVVRVAKVTATHRLNYRSVYASAGQVKDTHIASSFDQDTAETQNVIYEHDISGLLGSIVVGDLVTIHIEGDATNTPNDIIVGLKFRYS